MEEATKQQEALNTRLSLLREQTSDESDQIIRLEAECKEMDAKIWTNSNVEDEGPQIFKNKTMQRNWTQKAIQKQCWGNGDPTS